MTHLHLLGRSRVRHPVSARRGLRWLAVVTLLTACSTSRQPQVAVGPTVTLSTADFQGPRRVEVVAEPTANVGADDVTDPDIFEEPDPLENVDPVFDPDDETPTLPPGATGVLVTADGERAGRMQPGQRMLVDSLVGQVNGRPIFSEEFFADIDDRLRRASEEMDPRQFQGFLRETVEERLRFVIRNELLLAEAESELTVQQQTGLFGWLRDVREGQIAKAGGTATGAESRLSDEGITLDEFVSFRRDLALLNNLFQSRIESRVVISWRDVERAFRRNESDFNEVGSIILARIVCRGDAQQADADAVVARVRAGEDFIDVARELRMPASFLDTEYELDDDGRPVGAIDEFADAVAGHEGGEVCTPFTRGSVTMVLFVVNRTSPVTRTLYDRDIQRMLRDRLYGLRRQIEEDRFIANLAQRVVTSEMQLMLDRLIDVGRRRYLQVQ